MKRVIERCPNCGVEHDDPKGGACEVCGTTLRFWCRVHSKEIGWLDSDVCPRCAAEAATAPARPPAAPPPPRAPAPPPRPTPPAPAPPPPRPRRPAPRVEPADEPFTERVDEPAEEDVIILSPGMRPRRMPSPWGGRDPGVVLRETAEDAAPYAAAGISMAMRLMLGLFAILRSVILWGVLGGIGGFMFPGVLAAGGANPEPVWTAMAGAMVGGALGLFFGTIRALRILFSQRPR
jgi:hypothetical protein